MTSVSRHTTARRARITVAAIALAVFAITACGPTDISDDPEPVPALPDGEVFAMVMVGSDESGEITLGVDVADMLDGEQARAAAIEDGVIADGEDLPNDFYIDNDAVVYELLHFADDPSITVVSGSDTSQLIQIEVEHLVQLWDGEYVGEPVYGIVPSVPIPMDVTVADGVVAIAEMVYLP